MSRIRDAMRKSEGEFREAGKLPEYAMPDVPRPKEEGPLGLVPELSTDVLAYYEAVGKQIDVTLVQTTQRILVFTGAVGGDGISTVISQYAEMLSRRGERILLIDGNPRHPSLHQYFNAPAAPGIAEFVSGAAPREAVVHPTGFANMDLVPLGRCADRTQAERITETLGEFQEAFRSSYDTILVDTDYAGSPFFSQSAVSSASGVVMVLRSAKTNREVAGRACDLVGRVGGRILGVILNRREFPIPGFIYRRL